MASTVSPLYASTRITISSALPRAPNTEKRNQRIERRHLFPLYQSALATQVHPQIHHLAGGLNVLLECGHSEGD
jgi:hypothetical protein